jgi:hypothetical protein
VFAKGWRKKEDATIKGQYEDVWGVGKTVFTDHGGSNTKLYIWWHS